MTTLPVIEKINLYYCEFKSTGFSYSTWTNSTNYSLAYEVISNGCSGWGESTVKYGAFSVAKKISDRIIGKNPRDFEKLLVRWLPYESDMYQWYAGFNRRVRQVKEGLSIALYDLVGKLEKKSFYELVGRERKSSSVNVMPVIHVHSPEKMKAIALTWYNEGYRFFKLKLRGSANEDIRAVELIKGIASDVKIYVVDANFGYKNWDELVKAASGMKALGASYFQNPMRVSLPKHHELSDITGMQLTVDSYAWWPNLKRIAKHKAAHIINLHPNCTGGIDSIFKMIDYGKAHDMDSIVGSSGWCGIQDKAYQKVAFILGDQRPSEEIGMNPYFENSRKEFYTSENGLPEVLSNGLKISHGQIRDQDEFGFGIEVDRSLLSARTVQKWSTAR